jgi:putative ABC transport system permease protein
MFQHNLLIAFRNLQRHKGSFLINLIGLSTGLACTFLIYLWVQDEWNFDKFNKNDKQLFQVMEMNKENDDIKVHDNTQGLLAESMAKDLPEVTSAVASMSLQKEGMAVTMKADEKIVKTSGTFAGKDFFTVFSFPLLQGNAQQSLTQKNSIVISEDLAINLFGSPEKAIGKSVEWELFGNKTLSSVSGVFARLPANNSMKFDFVLTYEKLLADVWPNGNKWWNTGPATFLVLKKGTDIDKFNAKIRNYLTTYWKDNIFTTFVRPYSSAYLHDKYENGVPAGGRIGYVKLFSLVAIFILLIACINFMNLSTAKASRRQKEVGIKKAVGSTRRALVIQFLSEAIVMALLSVILAAVIVLLFLPMFNQVTGKEMKVQLSAGLITSALGVAVLTGLVAGSYPAIYLSRFNPVTVLKGKLRSSVAELLARKGLVVFQFMLSLVLIVSVIVIYKQLKYVQNENLGYNKDNIIYFDKEGKANESAEDFMFGLKKIPGVINASAIQSNVVQTIGGSYTYGIEWPGKKENELVNFAIRSVDYDMLETLGIQFKEGRSFSKSFGADSSSLIFNETAINTMRLKDPLGTQVNMWGKKMTITGVVKDFHISSLHEPIAPMVFRYDPNNTSMFMVKMKAGQEKETLNKVEAFYKSYNPGYVFDYKFLDATYQSQYISEQRVSLLSRYFAGLAILISCLGLFGLATYNAEVRTKEIGIRKALGASVGNVMMLLSKDFVKLVIIAMLLAFPLSWWAMNSWLAGFAYRVNVGASAFIIAGISIIVFVALTISYQSIKAAIVNPGKSLRTE